MNRNDNITALCDAPTKWTETDSALWHLQAIVERLPFVKPDPVEPDGYADTLSGNWDDVPAWAIRRINFLEHVLAREREERAPHMHETCPDVPDMSCFAVKSCYNYLCKGSCGHNEIWISDKAKALLKAQEMI